MYPIHQRRQHGGMSLRQPGLCEGLRCDCIIRGEHPVIDDHGRHLVTGCQRKKQAMGIRLHHSIALTFKDLSQSAGFKTEEVGTFIVLNNLLQVSEAQKRMRGRGDVTIFDLPGGYIERRLALSPR